MYIERIDVTDFRCYESAGVEFEYPTRKIKRPKGFLRNVNLLLGDNGSGKTSILKAVAIAVLAPVLQTAGYKPYYLVRRTRSKGPPETARISARLVLDAQETEPSESRQAQEEVEIRLLTSYESIVPNSPSAATSKIYDDRSAAFFIVGYGATRRVEAVEIHESQITKHRGWRYQRVAGLFEDYVTLRPLATWLPSLDREAPSRFKEIVATINRLLPERTRMTGRFENFEPLFRHGRAELPFGALSDGYRAFLALVGDLLFHLHSVAGSRKRLRMIRGIVMVDDLDLHLHPHWQKTVLTDLAEAFPRLQFLVTSHSPLVVGTLHTDNLRAVEAQPGTTPEVRHLSEPVHGQSADQILTSSYFDMTSTRAPAAMKKLDKLAAEVAKRGNPQSAIKFLQQLSGKK